MDPQMLFTKLFCHMILVSAVSQYQRFCLPYAIPKLWMNKMFCQKPKSQSEFGGNEKFCRQCGMLKA